VNITSVRWQGIFLFLLWPLVVPAQQEYEITIPTTQGDTTETFWLQIPSGYQPGTACPLLIGWHTIYANHLEFRDVTVFDSIANARGWIAASHDGPIPPEQTAPCHWNNHAAQSHVVDMIHWIQERFSVDSSRIYMVGASMGGAAAMAFSNNHLDPQGPMVAAAASVSGIQDCERRYYEQGINYSMTAAFGGSPSQVPFTYHRNSAIYFADSTESMHFNAMHLPLWLTFGNAWSDSVWRRHAEDLYAVMEPFADSVVLRESAFEGHGWAAAEADLICDFFENFTVTRYPPSISINADEEGRWYWARIARRDTSQHFARFTGSLDTLQASLDFDMLNNVASARLNLLPAGFPLNSAEVVHLVWSIENGRIARLIFTDVQRAPLQIRRNASPYRLWRFFPATQELQLQGEGNGTYEIFFPSSSPEPLNSTSIGESVYAAWNSPESAVFSYPPSSTTLRWQIFDLLGRQIFSSETGMPPPDPRCFGSVAGLPSGLYFLKIHETGRSTIFPIVRFRIIH